MSSLNAYEERARGCWRGGPILYEGDATLVCLIAPIGSYMPGPGTSPPPITPIRTTARTVLEPADACHGWSEDMLEFVVIERSRAGCSRLTEEASASL